MRDVVNHGKSKREKSRGVHRKDDDADGPAVNELVIPLMFFRLIDDFWREVTWRPTHRLRNTQSRH
jgi:hypothetical protein